MRTGTERTRRSGGACAPARRPLYCPTGPRPSPTRMPACMFCLSCLIVCTCCCRWTRVRMCTCCCCTSGTPVPLLYMKPHTPVNLHAFFFLPELVAGFFFFPTGQLCLLARPTQLIIPPFLPPLPSYSPYRQVVCSSPGQQRFPQPLCSQHYAARPSLTETLSLSPRTNVRSAASREWAPTRGAGRAQAVRRAGSGEWAPPPGAGRGKAVRWPAAAGQGEEGPRRCAGRGLDVGGQAAAGQGGEEPRRCGGGCFAGGGQAARGRRHAGVRAVGRPCGGRHRPARGRGATPVRRPWH